MTEKDWETLYWTMLLQLVGDMWERREQLMQRKVGDLERNPATSEAKMRGACSVLDTLRCQHAVVDELRKLLRPKIHIQRG